MKRQVHLLSLVMLLAMSAIGSGQTPGPGVRPGTPAPHFSVTSLRGERFDLAALRGKVVVLNFWFTGCAPCVAEFPRLNGLVKEFEGKGVVFLAPALEDAATLKPFLKKHRFDYQVVPNALALISKTYSAGTGQMVFPTHIVIDQEGKVDTRIYESEQVVTLRAAIARLIHGEAKKAK